MRGSWMPIGSSSTLRFDTTSCPCQLPPLTLMYVQTLVLQHSTVPLTSSLSSDEQQVSQDDVLELLAKAVTCAILGKASNQRSRVLGNLAQVQYVQYVLCLCQHVLWGHTQHRWLTGCVCVCSIHACIQDNRISTLDQSSKYASHSSILFKMHEKQIIRKSDGLTGFEASLMPHQKAVSALA